MMGRRMLFTLVIASACAVCTAQVSLAKNAHHNNGHNLLGAKLNQDGKHDVAKIGNTPVSAEVKGKKVVNMSAGGLAARKVKSNKKMAQEPIGNVRLAANGEIRLAQVDVYYGYCFTSGVDEYCYWYPATDVVVTDTWVVYSP